MAIANKNDLTHIVRTTQQWTSSYDSYECIPEGVLCVEFTPDGHVKAKIGNGHDIFSKLPYIGGADLTNYFTKNETVKCVEDIIKAKRFICIKGILQNKDQLPSHAECGDLYFVISQNQSSSNKYDEYVYSPSNTWETLGSIPIDIDLSEYAKIVYVDEKIDEVNERIDDIEQHGTHTHANKDILDLITAAFTAEEKDKLSTLYNYDDTELRELITQASHTHSNKDILDAISAAFTAEDRVKLDSLTPYDDTILKEKITALERLAHEHSNKRILDRTTASFTTEYERKMRWIRLYTGCTGMEEGIAGLVPAAQAGEEDYVLSGAGEWVPQTGGGGTYELPIASASVLGGIKVGDGLEIDENGVLSATGSSGDSITEGDGITITTDPQTGVKTISVDTGNGLQINQDGELEIDPSIIPEVPDYRAGDAIEIEHNEYHLSLTDYSNNDFIASIILSVTNGSISKAADNSSFVLSSSYDDCYTRGSNYGSNGSYPYTVKPLTQYRLQWDSASPGVTGYTMIFENGEYTYVHVGDQGTVSYIDFTTAETTTFIQVRFGIAYAGNTISISNIRLYEYVEDAFEYDKINVKYNKGLVVNQNNELEVVLSDGLQFDSTASETMVADEMYLFDSRVTCQVHTDSPYPGRPTDRIHQKTNDEPALFCLWEVYDSGYLWTGPLLVGLTSTSVQYTTQDTSQTVNYQNTFTYFGKTWYTSSYPDYLNDADHEDKLGHVQYLGSYAAVSYQIQAAKDLIDLANVRFVSNAGIQAKLGNGLQFDSNNAIEVNTGDGLTTNSDGELEVSVGDGLQINQDGEVEAIPYTLPIASDTTLGGIKIGEGLNIDSNGVISTDEAMVPFRAGSGLEIVDESGRLPSGYTRVEYIENVQLGGYTRLNYYAKANTKVVARLAWMSWDNVPSDTRYVSVFGIRNPWSDSNANAYSLYLAPTYNGSDKILPIKAGFLYTNHIWESSEVNYGTNTNLVLGEIFTIETSVNGLKINNELIQTVTNTAVLDYNNKFNVFEENYTDGASGGSAYFRGRIYSFKIYEDDELKINLIPCLQTSGNIFGFYDSINNTFYPSIAWDSFEGDASTTSVDTADWVMNLLPATSSTIGGVKIGSGIGVAADGTISTPVMGASGTNHSSGLVPDPGSTAGTTKFLREDGTWAEPESGGETYEAGNGIEITEVTHEDEFRVQNQEYFFTDHGLTCIITGNYGPRTYTKINDGDIVAAVIGTTGGWYMPLFVGLTEDSVKYSNSYDSNIIGPTGSFTYHDKTWYYTADYALTAGDGVDHAGHLQSMTDTIYAETAEGKIQAVKDLIDLAVLLPDVSTPTINAKLGSGLSFDANGAIQADAQPLSPATDSTLGGVIIGDGILVDNDGTISVDPTIIPEVPTYEAGQGIEITNYSADLPTGYSPLAYIESTGSEYLVLDYLTQTNTRVIIDMISYETDDEDKAIFGTRNGSSGNPQFVCWVCNGSSNRVISSFIYRNSTWSQDYNTPVNVGDRFILDASSNGLYINNTLIQTITGTGNMPSNELALFACFKNGVYEKGAGKYRVFSIKIYEDSTLMLDLVPTFNETTQKPGLYDLINDDFYPSSTNTDFVYSSEGITSFKINTKVSQGLTYDAYNNLSVNYGEGLSIDPLTGALIVDGQLPEGTIIKKLTYTGNGSATANNIQFEKKPIAILSIYGSSGTNYIASNPAPIDAPYLMSDYGGVSNNDTCSCAMSYNDSTNVLTLSPSYGTSGDEGFLYNINNRNYTVFYLVKGHTGGGTSATNEVSIIKSLTYVGTGSTTNNIQFPETPELLLSIDGENNSNSNEALLPLEILHGDTIPNNYLKIWGNRQGSTGIDDGGTWSFNSTTNVLTLVGVNESGAFNMSGHTYYVRYVVNETISSYEYTEGGGISITPDPQTGENIISVNIGSGLSIDPNTGELNVTGGGGGSGDTVAEGAGIEITTDQQTGDKVIAVNPGSGLQVNQTTNELEVSSGVVTSIAPTQNTPGSITVTEGDGTATPVQVISQMGAATSSTAGTAGYVPAPSSGDDDAYLRGDGTWDDSVVTEDDELTLVFVPDDYQPS